MRAEIQKGIENLSGIQTIACVMRRNGRRDGVHGDDFRQSPFL